MYAGTPNQGMRCICEILDGYRDQLTYDIFDVRSKANLPGLQFDAYLSTGGPGNPLEGDGHWDRKYYAW
ncbi:MAG: GMP synthase, partial [Bacteroidetes bacterium]